MIFCLGASLSGVCYQLLYDPDGPGAIPAVDIPLPKGTPSMIKSTLLALALAIGTVGLAGPSQAQQPVPLGVHEVAALARHADLRDRDLVRVLQRSLRSHGLYGGAIDGIAGPRTMNGLRMAQQLSSPWIVPVVRHDLRTLPHVVLHGVPAYVTQPVTPDQIAVVPVPFHAPAAPWRVQHMYYGYGN